MYTELAVDYLDSDPVALAHRLAHLLSTLRALPVPSLQLRLPMEAKA